MTRQQVLLAGAVGAVAATVLVLVHFLVLPVDASWIVNRALHHVWEGAAALAAAGGVAWALWPRPKARRRDIQRTRVRRRAYAVGAMAVAAVLLLVMAELARESRTKARLETAKAPLKGIYERALEYREQHGGEWPASLEALPALQEDLGGHLYYPYRAGPAARPAPKESGEPPSYAIARLEPEAGTVAARETPVLAYLKPGSAWAPLTVIVDKRGRVHVVGEDMVAHYEEAGDEPAVPGPPREAPPGPFETD